MKALLGRFLVITLICVAYLFFASAKNGISRNSDQPSFPFNIESEHMASNIPAYSGHDKNAIITIPNTNITIENLSTLFRWYSRQNQKDKISLHVIVIAQEQFIQLRKRTFNDYKLFKEELDSGVVAASYFKTYSSHSATLSGIAEEWFTYSPSGEAQTLVVLKGKVRGHKELEIKTWTETLPSADIRIKIFEIEDVFPRGFYYTIFIADKNTSNWQELATYRYDSLSLIPRSNIKSDTTGRISAFLGDMYFTSIDASSWETWQISDALTNKPDHSCIIDNTNVDASGYGIMSVKCKQPLNIFSLTTRDFGVSWKLKN